MQKFASSDYLAELVSRQKKGQSCGIYSVCSANPYVLQSCMKNACEDIPLLIESTCNQVNPWGGYTGMTPADFSAYVAEMAEIANISTGRIILGGDHLGPYPWRNEPAAQAMEKACHMVRDYVAAGYRKIHLDASMHCGDDDAGVPLSKQVSAERAVQMCRQAEHMASCAVDGELPVYVIGTEVPVPGGQQDEEEEGIQVTSREDIGETMQIFERAFFKQGLQSAWSRVIALVVQPGVEFGDSQVIEYRRDKALDISNMVAAMPDIVFEAHSTDYQPREKLRQLVEDHFAILKVGPALTFALREAVFALAHIEEEWLSGRRHFELSGIRRVLEDVMQQQPKYWQGYYRGSSTELQLARSYSFSDRIRYYWNIPEVKTSLQRLLLNLSESPIPLALLSQYLPGQYWRIRNGQIAARPKELICDRIAEVLQDYQVACAPDIAIKS